MTKDFKNKQNSDSPFSDVTSWILAGVALGLFIGLLIYIFSGTNNTATNQVSTQASVVNSSPVVGSTDENDMASKDRVNTADQDQIKKQNKMETLDQIVTENLSSAEEDKRPTFDYHVILPTLDVEVPVAKPTDWGERDKPKEKKRKKEENKSEKKVTKAEKSKRQEVEKITKPGNYVIQVGAYKSETEALRMKSRVGSIGISTYVQKASIKGATWYRVRVGPLSDLKKINKIRNQLSSKGIASFKKSVK